jgi:GIY-YIG catalytic domain
MDARFKPYVEHLQDKFVALSSMTPVQPLNLPMSVCQKGVYLLTEDNRHLYVGRSNSLHRRIRNHCSASAGENKAVFAFRLAREATGKLKAVYKKVAGGTRKELMLDPIFVDSFRKAKERIGAMQVRFVGEEDPVRQALLEVYVAVVLGTPYNDFNTS